ncbi:ABC transporter ATP-binding protein [Poseidonibacter ostreae]|uniref:ATP-binding cassette domain-containing protein n=1 Tax=Poseidonibacter ostreae TaxID=2654171 RepID=A0A6L4WN73_9BACT|nr:ABC transporter ATP-binding protein [Poseidonibacter ostreae]KAB7883143.1 ATP-binding cassette domain-containing protein [Poseidonibacter ostreae]KAB7884485.1 ATP-binding cassette domain-containing protein [Poseidonibacter ostreae]KAB7888060.1 ATP-binding cassette domain-containing protein [Poseidonibacter ostreae]
MSILECNNLIAKYGDFQALFGIDFHLDEGETVAIIGSNGAGKSTFLKSITGLISVDTTSIKLNNKDIGGVEADEIAKLGISMVPEGRKLFPSLTVEENLLIGKESQREGKWTLEKIYEIFPILKERRLSPGTALSGGQQQMVAIGRGLMSNPKVLLCDEISLGLAPVIVKDIYAIFPEIKKEGISIVIVEQDINQALKVSDRVYCFQEGKVSLQGKPSDLTHDEISQAYFGV